MLRRIFWQRSKTATVQVPWPTTPLDHQARYKYWLLPPSNDSFAIAPRILFALLPYDANHAVTHLTAARGFQNKVNLLKKIGKWYLGNTVDQVLESKQPNAKDVGGKGVIKMHHGGHPDKGVGPLPADGEAGKLKRGALDRQLHGQGGHHLGKLAARGEDDKRFRDSPLERTQATKTVGGFLLDKLVGR